MSGMVFQMSQTGNKNIFPLSLSQLNIWDLERAFEGTSINNIATTLRINGRIDLALMQQALSSVISADPTLRTRIIMQDSIPMQYSAEYTDETFPVYDFSGAGQAGLSVWENTLAREPIPTIDAPLYRFIIFRTGEHSGGIFIKIHHIISDGWSQALICNRIAQAYFSLLSGQAVSHEAIPGYDLFVKDEQKYLSSEKYSTDRAYWQKQLADCGEPSCIKDLKGASVSPVGRRLSFDIPEHLNHAIYSFCIKNRVAPFAVFYMALAIYFRRTGGARRFTIGVPIFNRSNYIFKQCSGMFVSTLPFINDICDDWNLSDFNAHLTDTWFELLRHERFPFKDISAMARSDSLRLFQIALSYQDSRVYESHDASAIFSGRWHYSGYQAEQLCIHVSNLDSPRRYSVDYDYLTQFFTEDEIRTFHGSVINLLSETLADTSKPICHLSMLSPDEREKVLYTFNRTSKYIGDKDAYSVFLRVVSQHPDRAALISNGQRMTYRALDAYARSACAAISAAAPGQRGLAAILLPKTFSLYASILGALCAGWGYLLISPDTPAMRTAEILRRSGAQLLITSSGSAAALQAKILSIPVIEADMIPISGNAAPFTASQNDLAYVVYTSGSTGTPKGVEISQRSLINLAQAMGKVYGSGAVLSLCSIGFDAFVLESIAAVLNARTIVLPSEQDTESPAQLAGLIRNYGVGFLATTPSRLHALLSDGAFNAAMRMMSSIVCGGEQFSRELLSQLSVCTNANIYNQYGPSEAAVAVSHKLLNGAASITAGRPMQNCRLYVLDDWLNPLPVGVFGELYIGGECVGLGYRNDEQLTAERFISSPFESGERLYKTGDMARWTELGEIVIAGRCDRQIKLRGLRVEPDEISACIAAHPRVHAAAARVLQLSGQTVIAVYYTSDSDIPDTELLTFAASYLPRYMIPSYIKRIPTIPTTANGKVDEERLPMPEIDISAQAAADVDGLTGAVLNVFSHILGRQLDPDSDYFLFGGNSLLAMQTLAELEDATGCLLRVSDLYACRTARHTAQLIAGRTGTDISLPHSTQPDLIRKAPALSDYPLSATQRGIYFQSVSDPSGLLYNMPGAFLLPSAPNVEKLEQAFCRLVADDEIFRTSFSHTDKGVFAHVSPCIQFHLQHLQADTFAAASEAFLCPFDLSKAPLLRAGIWNSPEGRAVLFIDAHHIIGDGLTTPIVISRLSDYYQDISPELPEISYIDYSYAKSRSDSVSEECRQFWCRHLSPMPEPVSIPCCEEHRSSAPSEGARYSLPLSAELSSDIDSFCAELGVTPFALFLAAYAYTIYSITGQSCFTAGTPVSGRQRAQLQNVCGPLINVLPLKIALEPDGTVGENIAACAEEIAAVMDNSSCPPDEIISMLSLPREFGTNPLYSVTISMRPFDASKLSFSGSSISYIPVESGTAKSQFSLDISHDGKCYSLNFEYSANTIGPKTAELYARTVSTCISGFIGHSDARLGSVDTLSAQDTMAFFTIPDRMFAPFLNLPVHEQARTCALLHPDDTAVIFHGVPTTRAELERRACQIANALAAAGVSPGDRIGIAMSRTPELFAGMLAILKTGCAYVPLLSTLPEKRLCYMADTAGIKTVLTDSILIDRLPDALRKMAILPPDGGDEYFQSVPVSPDSLINVLFTSGSTGRPKGVMVRHSSVSNLLSNMREALEGITGPIICATTLIFDIFITESLLPLAMGRTIVLADEEEMLLPWRLAGIIEEYKAGVIQFTASRLAMCLTSEPFCAAAKYLQFTIVGGEQVSGSLVDKFKACCSGRLVNLYGPTENTVYTTMAELRSGEHVTIGRPMRNCRVYILDKSGRRCMPTAVGEMYLAGSGISPGYIARPDLTEAAFLPDPFLPGETMYKSGDLGRLRIDGSIDCLGRCDSQVKINGQRIEVDEIVSTILASGLVEQAAIAVLDSPVSGAELHAFITAGGTVNCADIRSYLREYLPEHMIPAQFHIIDSMPLTANGKTDFAALRLIAAGKGTAPACTDSGTQSTAALSEPGIISAAQDALCSSVGSAVSTDTADTASFGKASTLPASPNTAAVGAEDVHAAPLPEGFSTFHAAGAASKKHADSAVPGSTHGTAGASLSSARFSPSYSTDDILGIWSQVLGKHCTDPELSFFQQGGTSLAVLSVLSCYNNAHIAMSLSDFYKNPTASAQAKLISASKAADIEPKPLARSLPSSNTSSASQAPSSGSAPMQESSSAVSEAAAHMPRYVPKCSVPSDFTRTAFVTGGTGFLGAHLIHSLLSKGADKIICLVRNDGSRIFDSLSWYFGPGWASSVSGHIETVVGDVTAPLMGISREIYESISSRIDSVYHAAADVRHFASDADAFMNTNICGVRNAIDLALSAGAVLHHFSTMSIAGNYMPDAPAACVDFSESDFFIGQNWQDNLYVKSKMLAEYEVFQAISSKGLCARVYRLGRLVGRHSDGVFQKNPQSNMAYLLMQAVRSLGAVPQSLASIPVDLTPVDIAADAATALYASPGTAWHIIDPAPMPMADALRRYISNLQIVDDAKFAELLRNPASAEDARLYTLLSDMLGTSSIKRSCIHPTCVKTISALAKLGFFWPGL